jgi:mycofactocin precursor
MAEVCHGVRRGDVASGRMDPGGDVSIETVVPEDEAIDESEELLVEEISIDGLCGVY